MPLLAILSSLLAFLAFVRQESVAHPGKIPDLITIAYASLQLLLGHAHTTPGEEISPDPVAGWLLWGAVCWPWDFF